MGQADSPLEQIRFAHSKQNILCPHGTNAADTSLSPHSIHSRCCPADCNLELQVTELMPFAAFKPTNDAILMPFDISPLFLQLNDANNESVGLTDAAGDELEPMMLGVGIDQIFGDSPMPSSISAAVLSFRFQMLISSGSVMIALLEDVDDVELFDEHVDDPADDGIALVTPISFWPITFEQAATLL